MNTSSLWIFAVGFLAQLLFSARMMVQWIKSEKARRSITPVLFWQLSISGSLVFLIYGILRQDFAIVFGQIMVYFIYIRNLHLMKRWRTIPRAFRMFISIFPVATLLYLVTVSPEHLYSILRNEDIPFFWQIWGSLGQVIFTLRFYIQWRDSELTKKSVFTQRFWTVSVVGALMIIIYAGFRHDPVLIVGQLTGLLIYARNLMLGTTVKVGD